jgi:glycerol-3-phosphate dehydrogenase (NAD(P)+)
MKSFLRRNKTRKIGVIGAGGWGTALASILVDNGHDVILWAYESEVADEINKKNKNSIYLPGVDLPKDLKATDDAKKLRKPEVYVVAIPTKFLRKTITDNKFDFEDKIVVNVGKGIEKDTLQTVSSILIDCCGTDRDNYVILTGPSHAEETARKVPTTVVAAAFNHEKAIEVQELFSNKYFRVYTSDDVTGCELGGALKNVIAIAAGVIDGLELGDNVKAALMTRGLAEMSRLGTALGANQLTFSGLSGLGDLIVTCNSRHSRNRAVGEMIGRGKTLTEILNDTKMVAEGLNTTQSAYSLGLKHNVEMPIAEQMYRILFENIDPLSALNDLMTRSTKREWWW